VTNLIVKPERQGKQNPVSPPVTATLAS